MFISLQILSLKLNAVLVQASIISVFIVRFLNVVLITLFLYIRFKITLMVLFKGTLVASDVTLCHWVYRALILLVVSNKILDLSPNLFNISYHFWLFGSDEDTMFTTKF